MSTLDRRLEQRGGIGRRPIARRGLLCGAAAAAMAGSAGATWSIVLIDTRTREVAVGSATCLFGFDLQANTPVLLPRIGGATAQSAVDADGSNRVFIRDGLLSALSPSEILTGLAGRDSNHQTRQYGMGDVEGRTLTFSGTGASAWAGGVTGVIPQAGGDIVYAVQGNILTGAPVVLLAEAAIRNTPGDLAEKMMAGMEAARSLGGDGRCSCAAGPTACGSPPSTPWQLSAGIAYMLIARDGDREGSSAVYRFRSAGSVAVADFNADGKPDAAATGTNNVGVVLNTSPAAGLLRFTQAAVTNTASGSRSVVAADFNADGRTDLACVNVNSSTLSLLLNTGAGVMAPAVNTSVPQGAGLVVRADFDNDGDADLIGASTVSTTTTIWVLENNGAGVFTSAQSFATTPAASAIAAGRFNGDGFDDLAVASNSGRTVSVYFGTGAGLNTTPEVLTLASGPTALSSGDLNADGLSDLLLINAQSQLQLLVRGVGGFTASTLGAAGVPTWAEFADIDRDGLTDVINASRSGNGFGIFRQLPGGTLAPAVNFGVNNQPARIAAADFDGDGDMDVLTTSTAASTFTVTPNLQTELGLPASPFAFAGLGTGSGDYFMEFNVLGPGPGNTDPVFVLKDRFDVWRADLTGRPDAVRTGVSTSAAALPSDGRSVLTIDVAVRDFQGTPVTGPLTVSAAHGGADLRGDGASNGISTIGPVQSLGAGVYRVTLTAGTSCGLDSIRITIGDPAEPSRRPVVLMPRTGVIASSLADRTGDGAVDLEDFFVFFNCFSESLGCADVAGEPGVDLDDFFAFLSAFNAPCGS